MVRASVIGGTGYVGGELVRLLSSHPRVRLVAVTARSNVGEPVSSVHQNLKRVCDFKFVKENVAGLAGKSDVLFFALPHGESMARVKEVNLSRTRVIDLGADFRLRRQEDFRRAYALAHVAPGLLKQAAYGLPELYRHKIKKARLVACPGCFPTGALLALLPLTRAGLLRGTVIVDSKTGSSGSGAKPSETTHHPERAQDFRAYGLFHHRHGWEMKQELGLPVVFTPHSAPMVRGIFTTAYATLSRSLDQEAVRRLYRRAYARESFVRVVDNPRVAVVAGSNYCDVAVASQGRQVIALSAIDNLVKGAAGQAVQCLNIMFGFPETAGLEFPGTHP